METNTDGIDLQQRQIGSLEQKSILKTLAESAARPGCRFLEIGSWCGDSSVILGEVARQHQGHLFCVDWWKGNPDTELSQLASQADIFSIFWQRICSESLDHTVIPIRGKFEEVVEVLKKQNFDFIFIDADHRYREVQKDIRSCQPLLRNEGILCGHDCEGRITDFDLEFLKKGKDQDCLEAVHCGVVLAVGENFKTYAIDSGIWSVQKQKEGWEATKLSNALWQREQPSPPSPVGFTRNYHLLRYGPYVYAVPRPLMPLDLTNETAQSLPGVVRAQSSEELGRIIQETISKDVPVQIEAYRGYNVIRYGGQILAIDQGQGNSDLTLDEDRKSAHWISASTEPEIKTIIDKRLSYHLTPHLLGAYKNFNLVSYRGKIYGICQSLGPFNLDETAETLLNQFENEAKLVTGLSMEETQKKVDRCLQRRINETEEKIRSLLQVQSRSKSSWNKRLILEFEKQNDLVKQLFQVKE